MNHEDILRMARFADHMRFADGHDSQIPILWEHIHAIWLKLAEEEDL